MYILFLKGSEVNLYILRVTVYLEGLREVTINSSQLKVGAILLVTHHNSVPMT